MRLKSGLWQKPCVALLVFVTCTTLVSSVQASVVRVRLLVAYDEEWTSIAQWQYAYSPETLACVIISTVHYRFLEEFGIGFRIVDYQSYDSDDSLTDVYARFDEAIQEVQSNHSYNMLVAFTGQLLMSGEKEVYGIAEKDIGVALASHRYVSGVGQATDNILQHELSHLYGVDDHFREDFDCVMNIYRYWIGFPYYYFVVTAVTTDVWCNTCKNIICSNRLSWGREYDNGGGGGGKYLIRPEGERHEEVD